MDTPVFLRRLARRTLAGEYQEMKAAADAFYEAYQRLPALLAPEGDILQELDPRSLELLSRYTGEYDVVNGQLAGSDGEPTETERIRTVYRARKAALFDPVTASLISMWTNFAFGFSVDVIPRDENEQAGEIWQEFWQATRNRYLLGDDVIHELSNRTLTDGELFFVLYVSTIDGTATLRLIDTAQIPGDGIIYNPGDKTIPVYYKRQYTNNAGDLEEVYYPDWRATPTDLQAATLPAGAVTFAQTPAAQGNGGFGNVTEAVVIHKAFTRRKGRGWPLPTSSMDWSLAYKSFLEDRAAVAKLVAMTVNKMKVTGGSRVVDSFKQKFQSSLNTSGVGNETNPPPVPGTFLSNQGADLQRMPLSTGAGDAKMDGAAILGMAGTAAGNIPLTWLNRPDATTYAVADSMNIPVVKAFNRYQIFWSTVWQDIAAVVLAKAEQYTGVVFSNKAVDVNLDNLLQPDMGAVTEAVSKLTTNVLGPLADSGRLPDEVYQKAIVQLLRVALQSVGVKDVADVVSDEMFDNADPQELRDIYQMVMENLQKGKIDGQDVADYLTGEAMDGVADREDN